MAGVNWILTVAAGHDAAVLGHRLARVGARVLEGSPVPLGEGQVAVRVAGPHDLAVRLAGEATIIAIHPDAEMDYA